MCYFLRIMGDLMKILMDWMGEGIMETPAN
jgi:hypothetical protein